MASTCSNIRRNFESNIFGNTILLGDSGYPIRRYIMTSLINSQEPAKNLYNESHIRQIIERIWKRRFSVLSLGIRCRLPLAQQIIIATVIFPNIDVEKREKLPPDEEIADEMFEAEPHRIYDGEFNANNVRQEFIDYSANLLKKFILTLQNCFYSILVWLKSITCNHIPYATIEVKIQ